MCDCGCPNCHYRQVEIFYGLGEPAEPAEKPRDGMPGEPLWIAPGRPPAAENGMPVRLNTSGSVPVVGGSGSGSGSGSGLMTSGPTPAPAASINWKAILIGGAVAWFLLGTGKNKRGF